MGYQALIREIKEELGLKITSNEIKFILSSISKYDKNGYINNHFDEFYLVFKNIDIDKIKYQKDEVSEVKYFSQKELLRRINNHYEELTEKTVSWSFVKRIIENNIINEFINTKKEGE